MSLASINRTIRALCFEVDAVSDARTNWRNLSEIDLLYEAVVCMFSSQMMFEVAVAAADRLKVLGLLCGSKMGVAHLNYEARLLEALSYPLEVEINGMHRTMMPRFRNRLSSLLSATVRKIYGEGASIQSILFAAKSSNHARELLVSVVSGFGPKQSSLFLRRVGYCSELAILDTHIMDYLKLARGIEPKASALSKLTTYERIEDEFRAVARDFGHTIGIVDLAMWVTMRVAKREGMA